MDNPLTDKVILITGGAQGLGEATARILVENGARVVVGDINEKNMDHLVAKVRGTGREIEGMYLDIASEKNIDEVMDRVSQKYGRLDILINNAGIDVTKSVEEMSVEEFDRVLRINLRGPFVLSRAFFKAAAEHDAPGHIVNITSTAAKRTWKNAAAYHASKWGLLGLSHALLTEGRSRNIRVTAVIAGGMRTPFILGRFPDTDPSTLQDPRNVAETIKFVLSSPPETNIAEIMVLPMLETSWP